MLVEHFSRSVNRLVQPSLGEDSVRFGVRLRPDRLVVSPLDQGNTKSETNKCNRESLMHLEKIPD